MLYQTLTMCHCTITLSCKCCYHPHLQRGEVTAAVDFVGVSPIKLASAQGKLKMLELKLVGTPANKWWVSFEWKHLYHPYLYIGITLRHVLDCLLEFPSVANF